MVRPKLAEGGKRRLMVSEEAYRIFQSIAAIAELTGAGAAADRLALRYGELMRKEYETLNTPFNPANENVSHQLDNTPSPSSSADVSHQLDNTEARVRPPTVQLNRPNALLTQTNPLTAALGIF